MIVKRIGISGGGGDQGWSQLGKDEWGGGGKSRQDKCPGINAMEGNNTIQTGGK